METALNEEGDDDDGGADESDDPRGSELELQGTTTVTATSPHLSLRGD